MHGTIINKTFLSQVMKCMVIIFVEDVRIYVNGKNETW